MTFRPSLIPATSLAVLCALIPSGCRSAPDAAIALAMVRNQKKAMEERPRPERDIVRDRRSGVVVADRSRVSYGRKGFQNEGPQRTWYGDGAPESLREFRGGEPLGHWLTWWRTGLLQSSYVFDPDRDTAMVWWHANGIVASEGLARMGQRTGPWVYRWEHGALQSEGSYRDGLKDGPWVHYDQQGQWKERGRYLAGERFGDWEFRDRR